jgi:hypothetical protein
MTGITDAQRKAFRRRLLALTRDGTLSINQLRVADVLFAFADLIDVCARLVAQRIDADGSVAVIGSEAQSKSFLNRSDWVVRKES